MSTGSVGAEGVRRESSARRRSIFSDICATNKDEASGDWCDESEEDEETEDEEEEEEESADGSETETETKVDCDSAADVEEECDGEVEEEEGEEDGDDDDEDEDGAVFVTDAHLTATGLGRQYHCSFPTEHSITAGSSPNTANMFTHWSKAVSSSDWLDKATRFDAVLARFCNGSLVC